MERKDRPERNRRDGVRLCWRGALTLAMILISASGWCADGPETEGARAWAAMCFPKNPPPEPKLEPGIQIVYAPIGCHFNKNAFGNPLTLGNERIEHGIYAHAPSHIRITVSQPAAQLKALVGIDNNPDTQRGAAAGEGSVTFEVLVDGKEIFKTDVLTLKNSPQRVEVPLDGAKVFDLRVGPAGGATFDHAAWGNLTVVFRDGTSLLLDTLTVIPYKHEVGPQIPFSFVYGGKPSAELLPNWRRTVAEKALDSTRTQRTVTYQDPETGLVCEAVAVLFTEFPAVEWLLRFRNQGKTDTLILENVNTLDAVWPADGNDAVVVRRWRGTAFAQADFQPIVEPIPEGGTTAFAPWGGRSSSGVLPFFQVQWPRGGATIAIGWSGQWNAEIRRPDVRIRAGLEGVHTKLQPGESIRTARVLVVFWEGDDPQWGHNLYRRVILKHYLPRVNGQLAYPIIAHDSFYDGAGNEEHHLELIRASKEAGLEGYWLDAGWFEGGWPGGVGNWAIPIDQTVRKAVFPRGLKPLVDECRRLGLKFILWFEPEQVAAGTYIDRTYPQWVLRADHPTATGLFDLGNPEARRWMTEYLSQCIDAYRLDVLRIDYNIQPLAFWRATDAADRQGMAEIRYVTGLYEMWDEILRRHPKTFIDNCASGGNRIDMETNMRSIPVCRTDYANDPNCSPGDAIADQGMTMGLSIFSPLQSGFVWVTDPYAWRSANVFGPTPYWDVRKADYSREECQLAVKESQQLRRYLMGDFWLLTSNTVEPHAWAAYQYHRSDEDDGFACFFRRKDSPYAVMETSFRGVRADKKYQLEYYYTYQLDKTTVVTGSDLQAFRVELPKDNSSLLIRYRPVKWATTYRRTKP